MQFHLLIVFAMAMVCAVAGFGETSHDALGVIATVARIAFVALIAVFAFGMRASRIRGPVV
jgi:hypothetical protein